MSNGQNPLTKIGMVDYLMGQARDQVNHERMEHLGNKQMEQHLGSSPPASDDMNFNARIDSPETHHHVHQAPITPPSKSSGIGKLLLGAGLLATGVGAGVGVPLIADAIRSKPKTVIEQPESKTIIRTEREGWEVGEPIVE